MSTRGIVGFLAAALMWQPSAAVAKDVRIFIDISITADGTCLAKIGTTPLPKTIEELDATLSSLVPNRKADLRLRGFDNMPYRCIGGIIFNLQRLGYKTIGFDVEPPPLDKDIKIQDDPPQ